jgi:hypothetical protein
MHFIPFVTSVIRLVGKTEEKRPLERHRSRWYDNIQINAKDGYIILYRVGGTC